VKQKQDLVRGPRDGKR